LTEVGKLRILVKISHPAHVHFFRNFIFEMGNRGHNLFVMSTDTKSSLDLLKSYGIEHYYWKKTTGFNPLKIKGQIRQNYQIWKKAVEFKPDFLTAIGGTSISHVSRFVDAKSIVFNDSERADFQNAITHPFSDIIITPESYRDDIGPKQIRYPGYHELAYLHPKRFTPDPIVLDYLDVDEDEKIIVLRFIAWKAVHDVGQSGISIEQKRELVSNLNEHGKVFITSESKLPSEFEPYRLNIPKDKIHDLLYYADFYMGDSQTMATESAVLGTPTIRCNSFAGDNDMGNFIELEKKYGLMYSTPDPKKALKTAEKWIQVPKLKDKWKKKRERLLKEKIDVTDYMINFFEKYV